MHLGYVLHSRPFRETSLLVEIFTQEHGRIAVVARGAKRGKAKLSNILQPFMPLILNWFGHGELATLTHAEVSGAGHQIIGKRAICGLYVNELLIKLLHKFDPCLQLFADYQQVLLDLENIEIPEQVSLRKFERRLLKSLGYGLQLTIDITTNQRVLADLHYMFDPAIGPKQVASSHPAAIQGSSLLAIEQEIYIDSIVLVDAKRLMRLVLAYHLGAKQIVSRGLI